MINLLKKITSQEIIQDMDEKLQRNDEELLEYLESSLENELDGTLKGNYNFLKADVLYKINQLKELNSILKDQINTLEDIHHHLDIEKKFCPICNSEIIAFLPFGENPRPNAQCPNCGSLERHRKTYLFLKENGSVFKDHLKFLHIAPEKPLYDIFSAKKNLDYLTADLYANQPHVMEKMDIQNIQYPDNTFDFIYCSHVLEHVPNDKKALEELHRVLKNGGSALIVVPIVFSLEKTFEDPRYNTPELRLKYYGQSDHVRIYGPDFTDKLRKAGFKILSDGKELTKDMDEKTIKKYGINKNEKIFHCSKM